MASFEEDDESQNYKFEEGPARRRGRGRRNERDDSWDRDDPEIADITPDDLGTVRCTECRKLIFEDSVRCPYCEHLQLEEQQQKKPRWIVVAAVACLIGISFWLLFGVLDMLSWFNR